MAKTLLEPNISGIYIIQNSLNNKVYVGQSIDIRNRWWHHRYHLRKNTSDCSHLQRAWNKYGEEVFVFKVIEECPKDLLNAREIFWIEQFDSVNNGYNLNYGGGSQRGWKMTEEQRLALSEKLKGRVFTDEHRANMSIGRKRYFENNLHPNRKQVICLNTKELFENSRLAAEAYNLSNPHGINNVCIGRYHFSGELNGENLTWMYYTDYLKATESEIEEKIRLAQCRINESRCFRKIICLNTMEEFKSIAEAAKWCQTSNQNISGCLRNRQKTAGRHPNTNEPLRWEYVA